jgi:hypothetical protein
MYNLGSGTVSDSVVALVKRIQDEPQEMWSANYVVIEQQARINVKMIALSHALQAAMLLGCTEIATFASSASKFSVFTKMPGLAGALIRNEPKELSVAKRKKIRKQNSIDLVNAVLLSLPSEETTEYIQQLRDAPADQKDDLADAFVYALSFVYKNEPVSFRERYKNITGTLANGRHYHGDASQLHMRCDQINKTQGHKRLTFGTLPTPSVESEPTGLLTYQPSCDLPLSS